jgi:competence protein ComEC
MRLRIGYLLSGTLTALIMFLSFISTQPDGRLHIVFCDVGQGDGVYVLFPDGRDMVVDGGPNDRIIDCLGRHMPFWDRKIDIVIMTHPEKDHMQGLIALFNRYTVQYLVRSDVANTTHGYESLMDAVVKNGVEQRFVQAGEQILIGGTSLSFVWPTDIQLSKGRKASEITQAKEQLSDVMGVTSADHLNDFSLVFWLRYGTFDALFTGDADTRVESNYIATELADSTVELLKVPHHGSKTGMNEKFIQWLSPELSVISVGKNSYGHPSKNIIDMLQSVNSTIVRTDQIGDIAVISDGQQWHMEK